MNDLSSLFDSMKTDGAPTINAKNMNGWFSKAHGASKAQSVKFSQILSFFVTRVSKMSGKFANRENQIQKLPPEIQPSCPPLPFPEEDDEDFEAVAKFESINEEMRLVLEKLLASSNGIEHLPGLLKFEIRITIVAEPFVLRLFLSNFSNPFSLL